MMSLRTCPGLLLPVPGAGIPLGALQRDPAAAARTALAADGQPERRLKPRRVLRCAACGAEVTAEERRIQVQGAHRHRFVNPAGYAYDIACFGDAPGCQVVGVPNPEFTWFLGFAWNFAICKACSAHLGWHYSPAGDGGEGGEGAAAFFGLIANRLVETSDDPTPGNTAD